MHTVFEPLQGWGLHHCLGQPGPRLNDSLSEDIFPNIQSKPPLVQLESIASHPTHSYLGEETNTCLTMTSCQVVVESNKVPPQPPLLQAEQPQLPQPLLTGLVKSHETQERTSKTGETIKPAPGWTSVAEG